MTHKEKSGLALFMLGCTTLIISVIAYTHGDIAPAMIFILISAILSMRGWIIFFE